MMNKTLRYLLLSDVFILTGFGLIAPILAIYIKEELIGGTILTAGMASALFFIVKAGIQVPFSKYVDNHEDRIKWLLIGTSLIAVTPVLYIFSRHILLIFVAQIIYGTGAGFASPAWLSLWSTHLDKNHESFEWSVYSASIGLGSGITALVGAGIADIYGFEFSFILVAVMAIVGCLLLLKLEKDEHKSGLVNNKVNPQHYHRRRKITNRN